MEDPKDLTCKECGEIATVIRKPGPRVNSAGQVPMLPRIVCSDKNCTTHAKVNSSFETPYDKYLWPGLLEIFRI